MMNGMLQWIMAAAFIGAPAAFPATNTNSVTIPFKFERGHVMLGARLTGELAEQGASAEAQIISLMVDTGYGLTMLHPELVDQLGLRKRGKVTIVGIGGEEDADMFDGAALEFDSLRYRPRRVAALPSDRQRGRRRDGVLGSGFFRRFVVEIDSKQGTITLHEPASFEYPVTHGRGSEDGATIISLSFRRDTPVLDASIVLTNGQRVSDRFELDTGCDGALCLSSEFSAAHNLGDAASRRSQRAGIGGGRGIISGTVPELRLGRLKVTKPSASFFLDGSPADPGMAGHIGWDALRHFKVIIDYERRRLILEEP